MPVACPCLLALTAAQQDYDQAASALRPYTNTKAQKESVGVEREQLGKDQVLVLPGSVAVLALFSPPPLPTGTALAAPEKVSEKGSPRNKSLQGPVFSFKTQRARPVITQSLGHTRQADTELGMV